MKIRRVFFGGSFDPIHLGHLILAREVLEYFNLEEVIFIPTYLSPFKKEHMFSPYERLKMLRLALKGEKRFKVKTFEIFKRRKSYTYYTAQYLLIKYGEKPTFLLGSDSFLSLKGWKRFKELIKIAKFIVATRGGDEVERIESFGRENSINFKVFPFRRIDISSTYIRRRIKEGKSVRYLVPDEVYKFLRGRIRV